MRKYLVSAACLYLCFVIYGSLVPLHYRHLPLAEALERFRAIPYLHLGIGSRADWVANILLFIPLAFLWLGMLWPAGGALGRTVVSLVVWGVSLGLSVGIEFVQLFFPPRTVSLNDIIAEGIGAALGVAGWWLFGGRLLGWLADWQARRTTASLAEKILWLYCAVLLGYNLLPLDLTISPVELYHKWRQGRVVLIPFGYYSGFTFAAVYDLLTDIAVWIPPAFLLVGSRKVSPHRAFLLTIGLASGIELLQLFVFSRVSDVTDILSGAIGGWSGAWFGSRLPGSRWSNADGRRIKGGTGRILLAGAACVVWTLLLAAVFWYPYDFNLKREFVIGRLGMFRKVPLQALYYGSEFHAVTEVLRKLLFFAPVGAACAFLRQSSRQGGVMLDLLALLISAGAALAIELGQLALPERYPDSTDVMLGAFGGWLGYRAARMLRARLSTDADNSGRIPQ